MPGICSSYQRSPRGLYCLISVSAHRRELFRDFGLVTRGTSGASEYLGTSGHSVFMFFLRYLVTDYGHTAVCPYECSITRYVLRVT